MAYLIKLPPQPCDRTGCGQPVAVRVVAYGATFGDYCQPHGIEVLEDLAGDEARWRERRAAAVHA